MDQEGLLGGHQLQASQLQKPVSNVDPGWFDWGYHMENGHSNLRQRWVSMPASHFRPL